MQGETSGYIHLNDALAQMDERQRNNRPLVFSIKFMKSTGQFVNLENCVRVGLSEGQHKKKYIGIMIVDSAEHVMPVHIRGILKFNNKKVFY